jgi:acyl-CoA reductase-like NAD-dependent aldehyde dehydrogenase
MNLVNPTELARIIEQQTGEPFTRQAVHKAIAEGIIPFTLQGKKKLVDLDNQHVQGYIRDNNRQREQVKKNDTAKLPEKKQGKQKIPSKLLDEIGADIEELSDFDIKQKIKLADMRIKEARANHAEKKLVATEFVQNYLFKYIENLNSNIERIAAVQLKEVGKSIIEEGEVKPVHITKFTNQVLEVIHLTKKNIIREIENYEPKTGN